jgi:uncharacterized membrane protein YcjF (UPF0283 family)
VIDLFTTPKAVGIATGISSALAIQVAQLAQNTSAMTEWTVLAAFGAGAIGWGVAWGSMRTKLSAQEVARKELKADADKVATELKTNNKEVAIRVEGVASKVDEHTDKLRGEIKENAEKTQDTLNTILREIGVLSATLDSTVRDTRLMITEHVLNCPAIPKPRKH